MRAGPGQLGPGRRGSCACLTDERTEAQGGVRRAGQPGGPRRGQGRLAPSRGSRLPSGLIQPVRGLLCVFFPHPPANGAGEAGGAGPRVQGHSRPSSSCAPRPTPAPRRRLRAWVPSPRPGSQSWGRASCRVPGRRWPHSSRSRGLTRRGTVTSPGSPGSWPPPWGRGPRPASVTARPWASGPRMTDSAHSAAQRLALLAPRGAPRGKVRAEQPWAPAPGGAAGPLPEKRGDSDGCRTHRKGLGRPDCGRLPPTAEMAAAGDGSGLGFGTVGPKVTGKGRSLLSPNCDPTKTG